MLNLKTVPLESKVSMGLKLTIRASILPFDDVGQMSFYLMLSDMLRYHGTLQGAGMTCMVLQGEGTQWRNITGPASQACQLQRSQLGDDTKSKIYDIDASMDYMTTTVCREP